MLNEWSYPECASPSPITGTPEESLVAWRRDGTELLRAVTVVGTTSFHLKRYEAATASVSLVSTGPTFTGYLPDDIHWSPEGGRVILHEREIASSTCQLAIRQTTAPHALVEPAIALNPEACAWRPRLVPLRERLMASSTKRPTGGPAGGPSAEVRSTAPLEHRVRAN